MDTKNFKSSKWLVVAMVFLIILVSFFWLVYQQSISGRKTVNAVITRQFTAVMHALEPHISNGRYPDLPTLRQSTNDVALAKAFSQTSLIPPADWLYNPSQPANGTQPDTTILGVRYGNRIIIMQLDGAVLEITQPQLAQTGLVPLFAP